MFFDSSDSPRLLVLERSSPLSRDNHWTFNRWRTNLLLTKFACAIMQGRQYANHVGALVLCLVWQFSLNCSVFDPWRWQDVWSVAEKCRDKFSIRDNSPDNQCLIIALWYSAQIVRNQRLSSIVTGIRNESERPYSTRLRGRYKNWISGTVTMRLVLYSLFLAAVSIHLSEESISWQLVLRKVKREYSNPALILLWPYAIKEVCRGG